MSTKSSREEESHSRPAGHEFELLPCSQVATRRVDDEGGGAGTTTSREDEGMERTRHPQRDEVLPTCPEST